MPQQSQPQAPRMPQQFQPQTPQMPQSVKSFQSKTPQQWSENYLIPSPANSTLESMNHPDQTERLAFLTQYDQNYQSLYDNDPLQRYN
ncbi:hypothetical protein [Candidatus Epulonipiscium viviparus]|uniref:hypothetical protein n=1 Tax=Candidatus Epulonipiscium viviparus TaxID=420336 RepID=UPI0027380D2A|nr:hypothetical protein [Candidatus Epulopiscium viviparus]